MHEPRVQVPDPIEPRSRLGRSALIAVVILGIAFVVGLLPRLHQRQAVIRTTHDLSVPTVTVVSPAPAKTGAPLSVPGEIRAFVEAPIYARATGYVKSWSTDLGSNVTAGQVLAELETPELIQDLANGRAQLRQSEAAAALATSTAARWTEMLKATLISQQEADEKLADARLKVAMVESAQATVHRLEELMGFAHIVAPFGGTITARRLDVGQLVAAGNGTELFRLSQTRTLRVFVRVPQTFAGAIAVGQSAEVTLNGHTGRSVRAKVVRTAGVLDATSRTLLTELELPNSDHSILPGSYAQVRFIEAINEVALTIPANTLLFRPEGPSVGVVKGDGEVELRAVVLGRDLGARVEIISGVGLQDRLVLNPPDSLIAGAQVRISELTKSADVPLHP